MTTLPPESAREMVANAAQVLQGAMPSALGAYRLLACEDHARVMALLVAALKQLDRETVEAMSDATGHP